MPFPLERLSHKTNPTNDRSNSWDSWIAAWTLLIVCSPYHSMTGRSFFIIVIPTAALEKIIIVIIVVVVIQKTGAHQDIARGGGDPSLQEFDAI